MKFYNETLFFPAISIATHTQLLKEDWKIKNKSPRFYLNSLKETKQLFRHPYILTSAGHNYKKMDFMKSIGIEDLSTDVNQVFGDSGGFQIATKTISGDDETIDKIYSWLEKNSTLAPIIDIPPWSDSTDSSITKADVDVALKRTKYNIEKLLKREKSNVTWLNVTQSKKYEDRLRWYNEVKEYNLDGWALGSMTISRNFYVMLAAMATLIDSKEIENTKTCKHIHFFGITATRYMPVIIYIKHKLNKLGYKINVSFDSSYATQNGGWGKYLLFPSSTGFCSYHLSNKFIGKFKDVELPCSCPVCKDIRLKDVLNEKSLTSEGQSYFYNVVQSHNVYVLTEYVRVLQSLIYTDYHDLMNTSFKSSQMKVFKIIDGMFERTDNRTANKYLEDNVQLLTKIETNLSSEEEEAEHTNEMFDGLFE
jgi:tRNA-guanine family transglycosylase